MSVVLSWVEVGTQEDRESRAHTDGGGWVIIWGPLGTHENSGGYTVHCTNLVLNNDNSWLPYNRTKRYILGECHSLSLSFFVSLGLRREEEKEADGNKSRRKEEAKEARSLQ